MTERPESLPGRPSDAARDLLSDVLRAIRVTRAIYYTVDTGSPWPAIHVPQGSSLASSLGPPTRTVLSYHVVVEGGCWTGLAGPTDRTGPELVRLERGDVVVYPRGDAYVLADDAAPGPAGSTDADALRTLLAGVRDGSLPASVVGRPGADRTRFVCGFLGCDAPPFSPLLQAMPAMLVVRDPRGPLARLVELALTEVDGAGAASVRERLSESMFIETIRSHIAPGTASLRGGLDDPLIGRALGLLHAAPTEPWTSATLARQVGASRSALVARFTRRVGQPPMRYLTALRLRIGADRLGDSDATVADAAHAAGYESEAAFSRAFKRATGVTPGAWREARARAGDAQGRSST